MKTAEQLRVSPDSAFNRAALEQIAHNIAAAENAEKLLREALNRE